MQRHDTTPDSGQDPQEGEGRPHWLFGVALVVMAVAIAGMAWYAYPILKGHELSLARLPGMEQALQQNLRNMDGRLADWYQQHEELRGKVDKLGQDMRARTDSLRKETSEAAAAAREAMMRRVRDEIERQTAPQRAGIDRLATSQEQDQARIANLQEEVSQVHGEVARQGEELARQSDELAALHRQIDGDGDAAAGDLNATQRLGVDRFDFEISKGESRELAPGVSLALTGTNFENRRLNGWVRLAPDGRTIWLRDRSVQEPVVFYGPGDGKKRELVITQVTRQSIAGYLLMPKAAPQLASHTGAAVESAVAR